MIIKICSVRCCILLSHSHLGVFWMKCILFTSRHFWRLFSLYFFVRFFLFFLIQPSYGISLKIGYTFQSIKLISFSFFADTIIPADRLFCFQNCSFFTSKFLLYWNFSSKFCCYYSPFFSLSLTWKTVSRKSINRKMMRPFDHEYGHIANLSK